jgi:uncharacterized protein (DUF58 family)
MAISMVLGVAASTEPVLRVDTGTDTDRCLEGDVLSVSVTVSSDRPVEELRVVTKVPRGLRADGGVDRTIHMKENETRTIDITMKATRWGIARLGTVGVEAFGPGRYVVWRGITDRPALVKVFPLLEKIRSGPRPPRQQVFAGDHVSNTTGDGLEFAHVRAFQPGDRVRSVNWRVTTRRGELFVDAFHPERNADVVVLVDAFGDLGDKERSSLTVAVRGAAAVVGHHLRRHDRVGLISFGGETRWLTASMSQTQLYRITDALLESRAVFSYAWKDIELLPRPTIPPSALVVAFSPLADERCIRALEDLAGRRTPLVVVDTLPASGVPSGATSEERLAYRVWGLRREAIRGDLAALGVPVVTWSESTGLDAVLASVPRLVAT